MAHEKYNLILFISGMSVKSGHAIENLKKICDEHLNKNFKLQIIDVSKEKEKAIEHQIFALPALLKVEPAPVRTILGDLSDEQKVLKILEIQE